jgi:hypothetical protein
MWSWENVSTLLIVMLSVLAIFLVLQQGLHQAALDHNDEIKIIAKELSPEQFKEYLMAR